SISLSVAAGILTQLKNINKPPYSRLSTRRSKLILNAPDSFQPRAVCKTGETRAICSLGADCLLDASPSLSGDRVMKRTPTVIIAIAALLNSAAVASLLAAESGSISETQTGVAACYSRRLKGHRTSSGQRYDPDALTASHASIP